MSRKPRAALVAVLALVVLSACSESPTGVIAPTEAKVTSFSFAPAAMAENVFVNGSFEDGLVGWAAEPLFSLAPWGATPASAGHTGLVATHLLDFGPENHTLSQTVTLPSDAVEISWTYRIQWISAAFDPLSFPPADLPEGRTFDVQVEDLGTGTVTTLFSYALCDTRLATPDAPCSGDTGWQTVTVSYTGVTGQSVRVVTTQTVPGSPGMFSPAGPGLFEIDDFFMPKPLPPTNDPVTKDQCVKGGWEAFGFKNQGQCIRFVETGKDSRQDA